ncbi:MAG TPA: hypothetical protein PKA27_06350 [Fimbriimonadaceae bacterium]|nr:hypothetical protein [Fimbriimonadaceae bacterium]
MTSNSRKVAWGRLIRRTMGLSLSSSFLLLGLAVSNANEAESATLAATQSLGQYIVLGYNDLGMHCLGSRYDEICILPPANTMRATVIRRGAEPEIMDGDVTLRYSIPGNTTSVTKTNFWDYAYPLFGANLLPDIGLFGKGMTGTMDPTTDGDWIAAAIPITPITDAGIENPYQLASITVSLSGQYLAATQAVIPVSWEMRCDSCHNTKGITPETDILRKHDRLHGTQLESQKPVLCARCHADPALGLPGDPSVSNLSHAMHKSHANRKFPGKAQMMNACYACHPGPKTQCMRDVHYTRAGNVCVSCHGTMAAVANPARRPWVDQPRCGNCHHEQGHEYEQPGVLYRDSKGHGGVKCEACHGSPHAIAPTRQPNDNVQAIALQGHAGTISECAVCHTTQPTEAFFHSREH